MTGENVNVSYKTIDPLLNPETVAILGASSNQNKLGYRQVQALLDGGFQGEIYPINPKSQEIAGLPCYASLSQVPKTIDMAVLCVSADNTESVLMDCAENGVKAAILFAAGYSETGSEGMEKQQRLEHIAKTNGIRMIGPNCVGLINTMEGLVSTFSPGLTELPLSDKREVSFVTQSGAFGVLTYIAAAQAGLTFNYFVSVGNEADIKFSDLVEYMLYDDKTSIISGYLEGEKEPKKLQQLAQTALEKNKPIVIMKSGRSSAGSAAAASHTGALAGSDRIYDDFFKQTGIVRAEDYQDIISFSKLHLSGKIPAGPNTVLITSSGGRGINEADRCESHGLNIMALRDETKQAIEERIPSYGSAANPIDLTAEAAVTHPELWLEPLKVLVDDPEIDTIIFTEFENNWNADSPYLQEFIRICNRSDKLIFITPFPLEGMTYPNGTETLEQNGVPVIPDTLNPVRSLAKLVNYGEKYRSMLESTKQPSFSERPVKQDISHLLSSGSALSEYQASSVLEHYDITAAKKALATTGTEAVDQAEAIGFPVVLKIDSPDITHKTEADAVKLNLSSETEVRTAFEDIMTNSARFAPGATLNGVSVQQMLPAGIEVICGVSNNPIFGPVVMFGLGGVFVEVFEDITFRIAPLTRADALEMIQEVRGFRVLEGTRGKSPADIEEIADVLVNVSELAIDYQEQIKELDINPLIVYENGAIAADAMIALDDTKTQSLMGG